MSKIKHLDLPESYRLFVISDIHAHHELMVKMLDQLQIKDDDYLVILGDFINKGINSYKTLEMIKGLNYNNIHVLKGNHELAMEQVLKSKEAFESIDDFMIHEHYETLLHSVLREKGMTYGSFKTSGDAYDFIRKHLIESLSYIERLPIVLKTKDHIFVHGGYHSEDVIVEEKKYLKYDRYNELGEVNDLPVVVGHWPTCNLRNDYISNKPFFNDEKKIISIDGGIGVKSTGELSVLVIEKEADTLTYSDQQLNHFQKAHVIKCYDFEREDLIYVNYPDYDFEVIAVNEQFTTCLHNTRDKQFSVFNELLEYDNEKVSLRTNFVNNFLNLDIGEEVFVVNSYETCSLVKYKEEFGWLFKDQLEMKYV